MWDKISNSFVAQKCPMDFGVQNSSIFGPP